MFKSKSLINKQIYYKAVLIICGFTFNSYSAAKVVEDEIVSQEMCRSLGLELIIELQKGNQDAVTKLINSGADVNAMDTEGITALKIAIKKGYIDIVKQLIDKGANVNSLKLGNDLNIDFSSAIFLAIQQKNAAIVTLLIKAGANLNSIEYFGRTPLITAVGRGDKGIVKLLVDAGADINMKDGLCDLTPLMWTIMQNNCGKGNEIAEFLVNSGADIDKVSKKRTALDIAYKNDNREIIDLLKAEAPRRQFAKIYREKMTEALKSTLSLPPVLNDIINTYLSTELKDVLTDYMQTEVLIAAIMRKDIPGIENLISNGVNVNIRSCFRGSTAIMFAAETGNKKIIRQLIKAGADINAVNDEGNTALIFAAFHRSEDIIKILIKSGADVNIANKKGITAIQLLKKYNITFTPAKK